jgi:molecular chaperone DnaK
MKLGEAMYKAQQDGQPGAGGPDAGGPGGGPGGEPGKKEDVVDAEFTEVDDDKKNKKSA